MGTKGISHNNRSRDEDRTTQERNTIRQITICLFLMLILLATSDVIAKRSSREKGTIKAVNSYIACMQIEKQVIHQIDLLQ